MLTNERNVAPVALAEVAHELRAPLGGIEAMAQLLLDTRLDPEQRRMVDGLLMAAGHLRAVASEVIDQARGEATGHPATNASRFSLPSLMDAVSTAAEARARAKRLEFRTELDSAAPADLIGDPRRIRQMLENLLDNAFKVTTAGQVSLAVRQVDRRGEFCGLLFEVRDTGPGLTAAQQDKLFRAFSRVDNGVPGSGLGLALVARMARAMGGDAGCTSGEGAGATFWFTLRLKVAAAGDAASGEAPRSGAAADAPVLVVDDNQANRIIMSAILEHFGHSVVEAQTGEEALEIIRSMTLKAVMLDQTLPGISGLQTLMSLRQMAGPVAALPVIPVTGRVAPEDKAAFAAAGANGFVEKPINARTVRDALEAALAGASSGRNAA